VTIAAAADVEGLVDDGSVTCKSSAVELAERPNIPGGIARSHS
jgi:hypothetical protein